MWGGREEERAARDRCVCVCGEGNWRGRGLLETGVCEGEEGGGELEIEDRCVGVGREGES